MESFLQTEKMYTVLELNTAVRRILKSEFPEAVWVCGEIQDFRSSRDKRHIYFSLVQKHPEADEIIAKVSVAIFEGRKPQIFKRLEEADKVFEFKNDIEVKLKCELDLYPKTGNFSLIVVDIDPIYTLGKIAQSRQRIIEDLRKRGLLEKNKTKVLTSISLRIGLITAYNSKAYHDFTNELKASGYGFKVLIYNAHMQGEHVEPDILAALKAFNTLTSDELDVIVITRGGGSTADLSWFDNKKIAEGIANSNFAVITGLGHETDITISDLVAHTSCKTPTKSAQFLIENIKIFMENLNNIQEAICRRSQDLLAGRKIQLHNLTIRIDSVVSRYFRAHREELLEKKHIILRIVKIMLAHKREYIRQQSVALRHFLPRFFKYRHEEVKNLQAKIRMLDPKNVLKRGYSVTFKNKSAVKSVDDLEVGDVLRTVLYKGGAISQVQKKELGHE
jgi:exodeoxyribonuclease VII large subunit